MSQRANELKNTTYEIIIAALSVLSIFNLALILFMPTSMAASVADVMDGFLTLIFLADFVYRLLTAESRSGYFLRQFGWADLLASLPFPQLKILRLFRVFRAVRMMRAYGPMNMLREFVADRAGSALLTLLFLIVLVLEFGGMLILSTEVRAADGIIDSAADAIWYTFVTITTVGYGDFYPVTNLGRIYGFIIMAVGVGLFGTLTGYLANVFLAPPEEKAPATDTATEGSPQAVVAELKKLLAEQKAAQAALEAKIEEISALLPSASSSGEGEPPSLAP